MISLIAAVADNGVIGRDNALIWRIKEDMKHFKSLTWGKPVVMGRKTFESIGKPLPGRFNIVISRQKGLVIEGATVTQDMQSALNEARKLKDFHGPEMMIIGGGQIYEQALPLARRIYLTEVHISPEGDSFFPILDKTRWKETSRMDHKATVGDTADYSFVTLDAV